MKNKNLLHAILSNFFTEYPLNMSPIKFVEYIKEMDECPKNSAYLCEDFEDFSFSQVGHQVESLYNSVTMHLELK